MTYLIKENKNFKRPKSSRELRNNSKLIKSNKLLEDITFNSASTAANFVADAVCNGLRYWKTEKGVSLKDYINKSILKRLKKYKVQTIELGVQSANDYILKRSGRGHTFEDVKRASKLIRWNGFNLGHQMMVGLPDSTRIDEINTAKQLIKLRPKMVRIYPVLVIKNTKLEKEYNNGKYEPIPLVQAVETSKEIYKMFIKSNIEVIRIGLQNTDEISDPENEGSQVVAGPYHPAFRQLVESSVWYDIILDKIKKLNVKVKEVEVTVNPTEVNNVVGHKRENILKLKDTYDVILKVKQDENIKQGKSQIKITQIYTDFREENKQKEKIKR